MAAATLEDLVFVGLRGYVLAVHRETGEIVWSNNQLKSGYTSILLDGDRLIVSTNGYLFCLHPLTGQVLWQQPLKGYGVGVTSLASVRGTSGPIELAAESDADSRRESSSSSHST